MNDIVINQKNAKDLSKTIDPSDRSYIMDIALTLPKADTNHDKKVSKEELTNFIRERLTVAGLKQSQDLCKNHRYQDINTTLVSYVRQAADLAVKTKLMDEIVLPSIPNLCTALTAQRT